MPKCDFNKVQEINLDEIGTRWIACMRIVKNKRASFNAKYFVRFGVEHIPKEIKKINRKQKYNNKSF